MRFHWRAISQNRQEGKKLKNGRRQEEAMRQADAHKDEVGAEGMRRALANKFREVQGAGKGQEKNWVTMWNVDMKDRRHAESH